jgi:hypothetical protein
MQAVLTRFLPYLPVLACPLLMLVCLWSMRGMGSRSHQFERQPSQAEPSTTSEAVLAARVAQLEQELATLRGDAEGPARAVPAAQDAQPARRPERANRP